MTELQALHDVMVAVPAVAIGLALLVGLLIGSFLNVVIYRLPRMLEIAWAAEVAELSATSPDAAPAGSTPFNLMVPRSSCPSCGHQIRWYENIPVFGWLALRGRCSACRAPILPRYPAIEALTGIASALAIWHIGPTVAGAGAVLLLWFLIALTFIDFDTQLLPDSMTLPLLWIGLLLNLRATYATLPDAVIGAVAGYLALWSVYWVFKLVTGKEGMGYGDFKLLAALGAWFGWQSLGSIILLSSVVGSVVGIALIVLARRGREVPMPFGPYLAGAGAILLFYRDPFAWLFGAS